MIHKSVLVELFHFDCSFIKITRFLVAKLLDLASLFLFTYYYLIPYPIISCFSKIQNGSAFLVPVYPGCPEKKAIK